MVKFYYKDTPHNFFHIPKTGGTSISYGLQENFTTELFWKNYKEQYRLGSQHLSYNHYKKYVDVNDMNFAVVRDPVARINSLYKNFLVKDTTKHNSFTQWFSRIEKDDPHILCSQIDILKDGTYDLYHFDSLYLLEDYLQIKLPVKNKINLETNITVEEKEFIKYHYREDYKLLEYIIPLQLVRGLKI